MITLMESSMLASAICAENAAPGFCQRAQDTILALLERGPTPGEALVDLAKLRGVVPADARAFGVVFKTLSQQGKIRQVGWCNRRKGHNTGGGRVWALTALANQ